jgi:hypothetical protein
VRMRVEIQCGGHSMATHHVIWGTMTFRQLLFPLTNLLCPC